MISNSELVNTVSQSTAAYLALLRGNGNGRQKHSARDVRESPKKLTLIDNETCPVVCCMLPPRKRIFGDSGAYFVSTNEPGTEILARILSYDPKTGETELAIKTLPSGTKGELIIDFTWLVERCLKWLHEKGSKISNPFHLHQQSGTTIAFHPEGPALSTEQTTAIKTLLQNPVAYVWGPPGTGKTRHVLAETVTYLMRDGKRVLVTAATNRAEDNALDAILSINRSKQTDILRVGIPSGEFSRKWPNSCEERALKDKMAASEEQEKNLSRRIEAPERIKELHVLIPRLESDAEALESGIAKTEPAAAALERELAELDERASVLSHDISNTENWLRDFRDQREALRYPEAKLGVQALEREHVALISTKQKAEDDLRRMSVLSRMFTKRPAVLKELICKQEIRITQVEETLGSQREAIVKLEAQDAQLASDIASLNRRLADELDEKEQVDGLLRRNQKEIVELRSRLADDRVALQRIETELVNHRLEQKELEALGAPPSAQELSDLQKRLDDVRLQKARISQNLSEKSVIGTTLDGFIGLTMNQAMQFDHIVVDEAGYAPLAKVIPLLLMHCPISLLGDHKQLPPVYEGENDFLSESYWGTSALYLEEAFDERIGDHPALLVKAARNDPQFQKMSRISLTRSYRFGDSLATLLDRHFYQMGLTSAAPQGTTIKCICCDAEDSPKREKRENPSEAMACATAVEAWLKWDEADKGTLAILTPYNAQVEEIWKTLNSLKCQSDFHRIEVMTVHKSQGREWDAVFFSASDGSLPRNGPWYADSNNPTGALVLNTAISRAKNHLRFFIDGQFWKGRRPMSLMTEIAEAD